MVIHASHRNRVVRADQTGIVENALANTSLTTDIAAASGTLTVANIEKFAVAKFVWINPFSERSEIIAVHASTSPSGSTVTLAANTTYAHYMGEPVYYVEFNQAEVSHASTATGSKSVLATVALEAGSRTLEYLDTTQTTGFYFVRLKDSVASSFGSYTDAINYGGFDQSAAGYMIDRALKDAKTELSENITINDCYAWINEGMFEIKGKQVAWPEHFKDNQILGQTSRGSLVISMPSDIYDTETNKSIRGLRVGDGNNLHYLEPTSFDAQMGDVRYTQVRTQAVANDTSLAVDNSYDFDDTGTLHAYVSGTLDAFTYTGVTRDDASGATAAFTGIPSDSSSDAIGNTVTVDTYIWQNEVEGTPTWYTVRNGQVEIWPLSDSTHDNFNVYGDYNTVITEVDSEADTIDFQRFGILQAYLTWRIYCKEHLNGELNPQNGWYIQYRERLNDAIRTLPTRKTKTAPNINTMSKRRFGRERPNIQDLPVDSQ